MHSSRCSFSDLQTQQGLGLFVACAEVVMLDEVFGSEQDSATGSTVVNELIVSGADVYYM